jgi:hypothetical protein
MRRNGVDANLLVGIIGFRVYWAGGTVLVDFSIDLSAGFG